MPLIIWGSVFIGSLALLVKGADWFIESAEMVGLALRVSPFGIGVTIVALGTSFPELAFYLAAVLKEAYVINGAVIDPSEIVAANIFGSNFFNLLLVIGIPALMKPLKLDANTFGIGFPFYGNSHCSAGYFRNYKAD